MKFEDLATFPLQDEDDWILTVLIGGGLVFFGFLFVPILLVYGYMVEVMRGGVAGDAEPPRFEAWGDLLVDGTRAFVVVMAYQIVPAVVGGGLLALLVLIGVGSESGAITILGIVLGGGLWAVLAFAFGYVGMAGVVNLAVEDEIGAAFDIDTLGTVATSKDWLVAWAVYLALTFVAGIVGSLGITYPFASFYALSAGSRAFGEAFASATGTTKSAAGATAADAPPAEPA